MEKKFTLDELRKVINVLEQNEINYYVFGGFALEAISKIKREHGDLDLIVNIKDKDILTDTLHDKKYEQTKFGRLIIYKKEEQGLIYKIGTLWMKNFKNFYKIRGNRAEDKISKEVFDTPNYVNIEGINFRIMPFEWFSLYENITHHREEKDAYHKRAIQIVLPSCKEVEILKQRPIKRLKSDPYYED